jgi:ComF family protein
MSGMQKSFRHLPHVAHLQFMLVQNKEIYRFFLCTLCPALCVRIRYCLRSVHDKETAFFKGYFLWTIRWDTAEAISQMKFHGLKKLSSPLGKLLLNCNLPVIGGILPVPLSVKGLRERGFNQSLLMARVLAKNLQVPLFMDILFKKKETLPQIGLSKKERLANLKKAFEVKGDIKGLRLLLIDDVMTTGATVTECSKVLMKAGAQEIVVLTLARAGEP